MKFKIPLAMILQVDICMCAESSISVDTKKLQNEICKNVGGNKSKELFMMQKVKIDQVNGMTGILIFGK